MLLELGQAFVYSDLKVLLCGLIDMDGEHHVLPANI